VRTRRFTFRAAAAAGLAAVALLLAVPPPQASAITGTAHSPAYRLVITSLTPQYATAGKTITVKGTLTNHSGESPAGLYVQLYTTPVLSAASQLKDFSAAPSSFQLNLDGAGFQVPGTLANGATAHWTLSFTSTEAGFTQFGVHGLEAVAGSSVSGLQIADETTFLPYWAGKGSSDRMKIAWVWPLIDTPRQTACYKTLTNTSLDSSFASGGRLGTLLSTGLQYAASAHLTWAVDPALLSEAQVMSGQYGTTAKADCTETAIHPTSSAAKQWLQNLSAGTANDPMFVTPYADADVSALSHSGLTSDLTTAYRLGDSVAQGILHRPFSKIGWPADGVADASVLTSMAGAGQLNTVVLGSSQMPLTGGSVASDAVASVTNGVGDKLQVTLADDAITSILASGGSALATEQAYLAQTAMIASEAPSTQRSIVVTPPRNWHPSSGVAGALLNETIRAPWLQSVSLSDVATSKPGAGVTHATVPDREVSKNELSSSYLAAVKAAATSLSLYRSILASPSAEYSQRLEAALAASQSSAWRGGATAGGEEALARLSGYVSETEKKVQLIKIRKATLAGRSGTIPVSVLNGLDQAVQVRVTANAPRGRLTVTGDGTLVTIQPGKVATVRLSLSSLRIGATQIQLQLVAKDGSALGWAAESVSVVSTLYGRAVLILIIVALCIVVFTSATRWARQWLAEGRPGASGTDDASAGDDGGGDR
jgi:hypothetical protein